MDVEVKVPVQVAYPDGRGFPYAKVLSNRRHASKPAQTVETDKWGSGKVSILFSVHGSGRSFRVPWSFCAEGIDGHGVRWEGKVDTMIEPTGTGWTRKHDMVLVFLARSTTDTSSLGLGLEQMAEMVGDTSGELILDDILELFSALEASLPAAALSMVGKVLDGYLKFKGRLERWWNKDWDKLPLGALLGEELIKARIQKALGEGYWDRLKGSAVFVRNVAVHQKHEPVSIQEAISSAAVVLGAIDRWELPSRKRGRDYGLARWRGLRDFASR